VTQVSDWIALQLSLRLFEESGMVLSLTVSDSSLLGLMVDKEAWSVTVTVIVAE
jgi:hypothetical protein